MAARIRDDSFLSLFNLFSFLKLKCNRLLTSNHYHVASNYTFREMPKSVDDRVTNTASWKANLDARDSSPHYTVDIFCPNKDT